MSELHREAFETATGRLKMLLKQVRSDTAFWKNLRTLREAAFQVEFLAKFYRDTCPQDHKRYLQILDLVKPLEDHLGQLDDYDAMVPYCRKYALHLRDGSPAEKHFAKQRRAALAKMRRWMKKTGWSDGRALAKVEKHLKQLNWLTGEALIKYARQHMSESLIKLQTDIDHGEYHPSHRRGYRFREVEPLVHKLRRDIRKQAQYMIYTKGLFALHDRPMGRCSSFYKALAQSPFSKDAYSRLPRAHTKSPLPVPRILFWALNRYVSELGQAKDWAFRLEYLREAGIDGEIDFDQLDVTLGSWQGTPVPFNDLVLGLLEEIRHTRLFAVMGKSIAKSR